MAARRRSSLKYAVVCRKDVGTNISSDRIPSHTLNLPILIFQVDAFTRIAFKGNPAAVCILPSPDDDDEQVEDSDPHQWMQSVAAEFNLPMTAFLTPGDTPLHFHLRWFTPICEVQLCGHATLAAAHYIFGTGIVAGDAVEFATQSGVLMAKKICGGVGGGEYDGEFCVELDFPVISMRKSCTPEEAFHSIPVTLSGAKIVEVNKTSADDLLIELSSWKEVSGIQPQHDEISRCPGRGIIITGPAPQGSGFDCFSRFFCPKAGVNEDHVCAAAHCAIAPYWSQKLGKQNLVAYMASPRGGTLNIRVDKDIQMVKIRGDAVTIMEGSLLV